MLKAKELSIGNPTVLVSMKRESRVHKPFIDIAIWLPVEKLKKREKGLRVIGIFKRWKLGMKIISIWTFKPIFKLNQTISGIFNLDWYRVSWMVRQTKLGKRKFLSSAGKEMMSVI